MSDFLESTIRGHLLRSATWAKPAALHISLHTADPLDAGTGTEVVGGSYARVARAPLDANWTAPDATSGLSANAATVTFPAPTANWGFVTHFAAWDAATAGNLWFRGALTVPRLINSGDGAPVFAPGDLVVTLA